MFKTLILKINQGPWGPWSKKKNQDKAKEIKPSQEVEKKETPKQEDPKQNNQPPKEPEKKPEKEPEKEPEKKEPEKEEEKKPEPTSEAKNVVKGPWSGEEYNKKYDKIITELMSKANNGAGGSNNGNNGDFLDRLSQSPKKFGGLIILFIVTLWLATGFYKVDSDENAIVLYFGKFSEVKTPGLNYHIPFPIGKVIKQRVASVNSEEFGYVQSSSRRRSANDIENLMLTGDENIVDIEFQVQWQISNIEEFSFNISQPKLAIRKAAESAMREIIAKTPISEALSDGKSRIETETRELLQQTLDSYSAGVRIILVQLRRVDPPKQVIDSFRDVQTAKADKEREINESQSYANDIIPRARGNAAEMEEKAKAYQKQVEADAQGEAARFSALYEQYKDSKEVTRKRIYLETMQQVYGEVDKVIIADEASNGGVLPYFPINDLKK